MVDIVKFLPPLPTAVPSNFHRIRNRLSSEQITLPILVSAANNIYPYDHATISNTKRWIGRCPRDPPRQNNMSDASYNIYRKIMDYEMARYYPSSTINMSASIKIKPQQPPSQQQQQQQQQKNNDRDTVKSIIGVGTTVTSVPILTNVDARNSRLLDALSKHVTTKAQLLRPTNNFINNTTNISSSWKKYWTSTHSLRRRKEANDSDSVLHRAKCDQALSITKDFFTACDSTFYTTSERNSKSRTPTIRSSSSISTEDFPPIISDKQILIIKKGSHISLPQIGSSHEKTPSMNESKLNKEKPLLSKESKNKIFNNDNKLENKIQTITTKVYKLPLPSTKPKGNRSISKQGFQSKLLEKEALISTTLLETKQATRSLPNTSNVKRRRQTTAATSQRSSTKSHGKTTKKEQYVSTVKRKTPKSKYELINWEEPYMGVRCDPPTPPCTPYVGVQCDPPTPQCSPSIFVCLPDNDPDGSDTLPEQNFTSEVYL